MKKYCYFAVALLAVQLLGSAEAATISLTPSSQNVAVGDSVSLDVLFDADGATVGVGAFDLSLSFNPSILGFQTASYGTGLNVSGLGDLQTTTPQTGSVNLYDLSFDSVQDILTLQPGSFRLATVTFNALQSGQSILGISLNSLSDANGNGLAGSLGSASVDVAPVPLPGALWLLGTGLAGLAGLARRLKSA